jgi:signal transduction histidine kinase
VGAVLIGIMIGLLVFPVRARAKRFADRIVYGQRATPYEVLTSFSGRVGETYATEDVLARMAQFLAQGLGADAARVWLLVGTSLRPEAAWPADSTPGEEIFMQEDELPSLPGEDVVPVRHDGEILGALSVTMPASDPMTPAKERLVTDLAEQAGLVLKNVRLIEDLRASRQRLVSAQDRERRKLERNIHDGAQQQLVALSVQLKLLQTVIARDPDKATAMAAQLQERSTEALEDLRDLARGIYPPLLADQGLVAALGAQARKAAVPVTVEAEGANRYTPDVEATAYFCVLEALNNIAKYADASRADVTITQTDGHLTFAVVDDGAGFDAEAKAYGTGLQGMRDRLESIGGTLRVSSAPGHGTTVTGSLPASPAGV